MRDVYKSIEDYNLGRERKILIINKKLSKPDLMKKIYEKIIND